MILSLENIIILSWYISFIISLIFSCQPWSSSSLCMCYNFSDQIKSLSTRRTAVSVRISWTATRPRVDRCPCSADRRRRSSRAAGAAGRSPDLTSNYDLARGAGCVRRPRTAASPSPSWATKVAGTGHLAQQPTHQYDPWSPGTARQPPAGQLVTSPQLRWNVTSFRAAAANTEIHDNLYSPA